MPVTKEDYNKLYPGGCPFKVGDKLTMLTREEYIQRLGEGREDFLYGGITPKINFGSSEWTIKEIMGPRIEKDHWVTELDVTTCTNTIYRMADIEFAEFWKKKSEIISEYQIY